MVSHIFLVMILSYKGVLVTKVFKSTQLKGMFLIVFVKVLCLIIEELIPKTYLFNWSIIPWAFSFVGTQDIETESRRMQVISAVTGPSVAWGFIG